LYSVPSASGSGETLCIRKYSFNYDLCVAIEHFAHANHLPGDYFSRLIWRESTFRPDAVSFKTAQFRRSGHELRNPLRSFEA
ncbi:hypothetical protein ACC706_37860, partial [Rhizobium johnstonii]